MVIKRESTKRPKFLILKNNKEVELNYSEFCKKYDINGIIKIHKREYNFIPTIKERKTFIHFNLEVSHHKKNHIYALPKIIRQGYYKSDDDQKPILLSFENIFVVKCISCREQINYEDITKKELNDSFSNLKTKEEVKKEIIKRYSVSLPNKSKEELKSVGVSITRLEILKQKTLEPILK